MLLKLEPEHDVAVIEMGMSHAGEIRALAKIAQPEIGVVTNVAPVHLEFFDSVAGIARAKYELVESLPAGGTAVLNADDEYVSQFGRDFKGKVVTYGTRAIHADVRAANLATHGAEGSEFDVAAAGGREHARLPLVGEHNILNALAAVAVGVARGLKLAEAVAALATLAPPDKRGQVVQLGNITVINDCYNCSNSDRRERICTAPPASTSPGRKSTSWSVYADWPRPWSRARNTRKHGPSLWPRPRKPASGWPAKRVMAMWCCSRLRGA